MSNTLKQSLILCAAAFTGYLSGKVTSHTSPPHQTASPAQLANTEPATAAAPSTPKATADTANPHLSDLHGFKDLSLEEQTARLIRLSAQFEKRTEQRRFGPSRRENDFPPSLQIWLVRMTSELSPDQTASLLESLAAAKTEQSNEFVRRLLSERLAAADPQRAIELGKKNSDRQLLSAAIETMAQQDGAKAIRTVAAFPEELRYRIWEGIASNGFVTPGGSFQDMAAAVKESPSLLNRDRGGLSLSRMLGIALAQSAQQDPVAAIQQLRILEPELERASPDGESGNNRRYRRGGQDASATSQLLQATLSELRESSPDSASRLFDALAPNQKSSWMHAEEAVSRFKTQGIESAIQFSEKIADPDSARFAAFGTWSALAQRDRESAFQWIDSLPESPFRKGVLTGVMIDTWRNSSTWGSETAAIEAGASLQNPSTRMEYYTYLLERPSFGGRSSSRSETIASLPISEPEKQQLLQRVAPIR